jgi:hypothetical protein
MLDVWDERKVLPSTFIEEMKKALRGETTQVVCG